MGYLALGNFYYSFNTLEYSSIASLYLLFSKPPCYIFTKNFIIIKKNNGNMKTNSLSVIHFLLDYLKVRVTKASILEELERHPNDHSLNFEDLLYKNMCKKLFGQQ